MKNYFEQFKEQWNRLNPLKKMGDDVSESDSLEFMEKLDPNEITTVTVELTEPVTNAISQAVKNAFGEKLNETISTSITTYFEENPIDAMSEEDIKTVVTESTKGAVDEAVKKITEDHKELMTLANAGKLKPTKSSSTTTVTPPVKKEENTKDSLEVKAEDLFVDEITSLI